MLTSTPATATREPGWVAFQRTHDVRRRERPHSLWLLMDGKSCPEVAPWLYRAEETIRPWVHAFNDGGLSGLARAAIPGRPT